MNFNLFVPQAACLYILQAGGLWYKNSKTFQKLAKHFYYQIRAFNAKE